MKKGEGGAQPSATHDRIRKPAPVMISGSELSTVDFPAGLSIAPRQQSTRYMVIPLSSFG